LVEKINADAGGAEVDMTDWEYWECICRLLGVVRV
jgi:hypothetical protein